MKNLFQQNQKIEKAKKQKRHFFFKKKASKGVPQETARKREAIEAIKKISAPLNPEPERSHSALRASYFVFFLIFDDIHDSR